MEIFELENVAEVNQVLPTLGQSLTITSSPKKCVQILQTSRKAIKRDNLKVILLSPKQLPWKVQQKLTKIGLTECAVEPIPQRTLSYKVNLHLRSIKVLTKQEQNKEPTKKFKADGENQFNNMDEQNVERGLQNRPEKANALKDFFEDEKSKKKDLADELIGKAGKNKETKTDLKSLMNDGLSLDLDKDMEDEGLPNIDYEHMPEERMPEYANEDSATLMGELKGMREELGGNLVGEANFADEIMKDFEGKSHFKEEEQGGNYEAQGTAADQLKDLTGKSNFKEDEKGGNYESQGAAADQLKDFAGKSNYKEDEKDGNYQSEGVQRPSNSKISLVRVISKKMRKTVITNQRGLRPTNSKISLVRVISKKMRKTVITNQRELRPSNSKILLVRVTSKKMRKTVITNQRELRPSNSKILLVRVTSKKMRKTVTTNQKVKKLINSNP